MNQHKNSDLSAQDETADIELSGEDVLSLSVDQGATALPLESAAFPVRAAALPVQSGPAASSHADAPVLAARRPSRAIWHWRAALAGAGAVSFLAIGAVYRDGAPERTAHPAPPPAIQQPAVSAAPEVSEPQDLKPVRIRNPFDKHEVFEFPAGTTEQQANDAVADMLLQRAMERQAQYDARHAKKRRRAS